MNRPVYSPITARRLGIGRSGHTQTVGRLGFLHPINRERQHMRLARHHSRPAPVGQGTAGRDGGNGSVGGGVVVTLETARGHRNKVIDPP